LESGNIITSVFVDNTVLITGDNQGILSIRQLSDGKLIQNLNKKRSKLQESSDSQSDIFDLDNRVNFIKRMGRLVWMGTESSYIAVYDLYTPEADPLAELQLKRIFLEIEILLEILLPHVRHNQC
jgi:hypothetical protein